MTTLSNPYTDPVATLAEIADALAFASSSIPWPGLKSENRFGEDSIRAQRYLIEALGKLVGNIAEEIESNQKGGFRQERRPFMDSEYCDFNEEAVCILKLMGDHARYHHTEGFVCEDVDRGRAALLDFIGDRMSARSGTSESERIA